MAGAEHSLIVANGALVDTDSQIDEIPSDARRACGQAATIQAMAFFLIAVHTVIVGLVSLWHAGSHALSSIKQVRGDAHLAEAE